MNTPLHPHILIRTSEESPKTVWRKLKDQYNWNKWELVGIMTSTELAHLVAYSLFSLGYKYAVTDIDPNVDKLQ